MAIKTHSRRDFLVRAGKAAALGVSGAAGLSGASAFATSQIRASGIGGSQRLIPYGCAVRFDALASDAAYRAAIVANCQMIVPEGEMKWPDIHPARGQYRFEKADALMHFASQHSIDVRGHTLASSGGMPAWTAANDSRSQAERHLFAY